MTIKCGHCHRELDPEAFAPSQRSNGKWCKDCFRQDYRAARPAPPPRPCEVCGADIEVPKPKQRFCSVKCKNANKIRAYHDAWIERSKQRSCGTCGVSLEGKPGQTKFCSEPCAREARRSSGRGPVSRRKHMLKTKYGMTEATFDPLLASQGDACAICGSTEPNAQHGQWQIDHCHTSGAVRGILCGPCNTGIGHMQDDPARLRAAADYLERT